MLKNRVVSLDFSPDKIGTITIRREESLNALNNEVLTGLEEACSVIEAAVKGDRAYDQCRVLLLRGAGEKAFVAGADIKLMGTAPLSEVEAFIRRGQTVFSRLEELPLPVIAVVHGFAIGGGMELALACDLIVVTENARLGQAEVNLGIIPGWGGTQRLRERIGIGGAKKLIFSGENITGEEAFRLGVADHFFDSSALETRLTQLTSTLSKRGPLALASAKRAIHFRGASDRRQALENEIREFLEVFQTQDARAGIAAFMGKQAAVFQGR